MARTGMTHGRRGRRRRALLVLGAAFAVLVTVLAWRVYRAFVVVAPSPTGRYHVRVVHGICDVYRIHLTDRRSGSGSVWSHGAKLYEVPTDLINDPCWGQRVEWEPHERGFVFVWQQCYADQPKRFAMAYILTGSPPGLHEEAVEDQKWALRLLRDTWKGDEEEKAGDPYREFYHRLDDGACRIRS
jgi:hypothetical protein